MRSRPIIVIQSILAAAIVFFGAAGLSDRIDPDIVYFGNLAIGAITAGLGVYMANTNTENRNVAVMMDEGVPRAGAGSAENVVTGSRLNPEQTVEEVTPPPGPVS